MLYILYSIFTTTITMHYKQSCYVGGLQVYSAFGLRASLKKVLNFNNMLLYAEYVVANLEFPRGLPSIEDDMFQVWL